MTTVTFPSVLYLGNDFLVTVEDLTVIDLTDGSEDAQVGWTDLKAMISEDGHEAATPIGSLDVVFTADTNIPNTYRALFEGSALDLVLTAYDEQDVYVHVYRLEDYRVVAKITVRRSRPM